MSLRALLLDVDGTIADTESLGHRPAYNRAFRKLGLEFRWGPKLYRKLLAVPGGRERLLHYLRRYQPDMGDHAAVAQQDPDLWVAQAHQLKSDYFRRMLRNGEIPLRPGISRLIREARASDIRVALVSNASRASLTPMLRYSLGPELADRIDLVVSGDEIKHKKPAPDAYLYALNQLGLRACECVALEDSSVGLQAATAAQIPTVITVNDNTRGEDFSSAIVVLDSLGEPDQPAMVLRGRLSGSYLELADLASIARLAADAA